MVIRIILIAAFFFVCACSLATEGIYHTVEKGQTLYRISRVYGIDERYLARVNGIDDPGKLEAGQLIYIPNASRAIPISSNTTPLPAIVHSAPSHSASPQKPDPHGTRAGTGQAIPAAIVQKKLSKTKSLSSPSSVQPHYGSGASLSSNVPAVQKGERGRFAWPLRGRILKEFGKNGLQTCQGIEIAAPGGTPVLSSLAGTVTYSGNGIRGYGNLIIMKHENSFYTVYAFNKKNLVHSGARVAAGEKIAHSGNHPGGGQSCLHFEIRKGKTAVNPFLYLP